MDELKKLWTDVIAFVKAANDKAEDGHLNARGTSFYAEHMTFEKVQEGIEDDDTELDEIPDSVFEVFFGGRGLKFPSSNEIVALELEKMDEPSASAVVNGKQVRALIEEIIIVLDKIIKHPETSQGENDLAASLSHEMQHRLYFLNNYLA